MPWTPITDLPPDHGALASPELKSLGALWREQAGALRGTGAYQRFIDRLQRRWAIETGLIERLYTLDRGITLLLVERGISAALIPHNGGGGDPERVAAIIRDHLDVAEGLIDFVQEQRQLSVSYVKELHAALTRNQAVTTALTPRGLIEVPLVRGAFRRSPNNPTRPEGTVHEYTPPEHVDAEMDRLIELHREHGQAGVPPEVSSAWLHHRFAQIHPFQDGNGRVARALASLEFLRAGLFPTVVRDVEDRGLYISALERADEGDLTGLVALFARLERDALVGAVSLSSQVLEDERNMGQVIAALARDASASAATRVRVDWARALSSADSLRAAARERLEGLRADLASALPPGAFPAFVDEHSGGDGQSGWYRVDVTEFADQHGYAPNFATHRSWTRLKIRDRTRDFQDEIVVSFHGLGPEFRGGIAVLAFCVRRETVEERREARTLALAAEPFFLTYLDELPALRDRFAGWLEPALLVAIESFRRGVARGG